MFIVHAIINAVGWAVALLAVVGLVGGAAALAVSAKSRNERVLRKPAAAPVWWDQVGS